ncbi:COG3650 family protein [Novosphingobium album (ex Liu et al. 2023)]|uniref:Lipoprotein n=1 Tax=Novosphingobium album (ex Liu et al. 2023) TaxID=3031130 RepID=A0ABT5WJN1_9SPHN|nr:hypothetical protein [Novosphingobium album (ex Liu et al. 2023)]MDE8650253.1 hypothetical protein [Novosphingobium album (ex Liu et al. 2023)]
MNRIPALLGLALLSMLGACHSGGAGHAEVPGDSSSREPFRGIAADEALRFTGTEPFWGGQLQGGRLTYTTPGNPAGVEIAIQRFGGRNGMGLSGTLDGKPFDMTVTPGTCNDGMSDRSYPFVATLRVAGETREGCAWSDAHPFSGPEHP